MFGSEGTAKWSKNLQFAKQNTHKSLCVAGVYYHWEENVMFCVNEKIDEKKDNIKYYYEISNNKLKLLTATTTQKQRSG